MVSGKRAFAVVLAIVSAGVATSMWLSRQSPPSSKPAMNNTANNTATNAPAPAPAVAVPDPGWNAVVGKWLREDGGYVLDISAMHGDGRLRAAYFNPRPIRVSRALVSGERGAVKVLVELNDEGYPGCLYALKLDRAADRLTGTYFQAALGETYEIAFVRSK